MEDLVSALAVLVVILVVAAAASLLYAARRRTINQAGTLQIWRGMERRGLEPGDAAGQERALVVAVRRCALCQSVEECEHWLAGERDDPGSFCPNTMFMENLERAKRRVTAKR